MYERFTDRAIKVMQLANQEAQRFNHEYIGTEHILLGLVKEGSGVAANVLRNSKISLERILLEVEKIIQEGPDLVTMGKLPQTPNAKRVIEYAIEESKTMMHNFVRTEHLLLGLLREPLGVAAQVLMNLGLNLEDVREEVIELIGRGDKIQEKPMELKWKPGPPTEPGQYITERNDRQAPVMVIFPERTMQPPITQHFGPIPDPPKLLKPFRRFNCVNPVTGRRGIGVATNKHGCGHWIEWEDENYGWNYDLEGLEIEWLDDDA